ncbi:MAG: MFS transporter [Ruminococcaceae bacterium]|nr:MFS transporter [Oscillospiraceae bacterium]
MATTATDRAALRAAKKQARAEKKFTKVEKSWIMYDWANSIYATNIMAAIFPIYFAMRATDAGDAMLGYAVSFANLLVAVLAPVLGAIGDFKGMKKKLFSGFLIVGLLFTITMAVFDNWVLMLVGMIISRIGFSGSCLFYDSFLTDVTKPERMERLSAWGYAMGYIGGSTIPFILSIVLIFLSTMEKCVAWYEATFPTLAAYDTLEVMAYKASILLVVIWWSLFSIPFLRNVKQVHYVDEQPKNLAKEAFRNMGRTFKEICKDKRILCFIIAYFFYIDGVDTIISLATNYGSTLGLGAIGMILALLVTQVVAVPFSILFGNLAKKVGAIRMISIAVVVYFIITIVGFLMGFNIDYAEMTGGDIEKAIAQSNVLFWILAGLVGTVQGGIQALSRAYFGQIIPKERSNEYFGFMDIFGKFSCVIGPALYSLVFNLTGRASYGILSVILLFAAGAIALLCGRKYFKEDVSAAEEAAPAAE